MSKSSSTNRSMEGGSQNRISDRHLQPVEEGEAEEKCKEEVEWKAWQEVKRRQEEEVIGEEEALVVEIREEVGVE